MAETLVFIAGYTDANPAGTHWNTEELSLGVSSFVLRADGELVPTGEPPAASIASGWR